MNEFSIVQIISLVACLVLVGSALSARRLNWKEGARMALLWAGIFVAATLLVSLIRG